MNPKSHPAQNQKEHDDHRPNTKLYLLVFGALMI
jgi:hypothetical protein